MGMSKPDGWCTVLPALSSLEPLLNKEVRDATAVVKLPPISKDDREAFNECLKLPGLGHKTGDKSWKTCLQDTGAAVLTPTLPSLDASTSATDPSASSQRRPRRNSSDGEPPSQRTDHSTRSWHLFLLSQMLKISERSVGYVASCLVQVMHWDEDAAEEKAISIDEGDPLVHLRSYETQAEAMQDAQKLRDRGLIVRITSRDSPPAGWRSKKRFMHLADASAGTPRGDIMRLKCRMIPGGNRMRTLRDSDYMWREDLDLKLSVAPEDAVAAYFDAESMGMREDAQRPSGRMRRLVAKHSFALGNVSVKALARRGTETAELASYKFDSGGGEQTDDSELEVKAPRKEVSKAWKDACRMMRIFLFGAVGNEGVRGVKQKDHVFRESIGTKKIVSVLCNVWAKLDADGSGRCDIHEFRSFAERHLRTKANVEAGKQAGFPEAHGEQEAQDDPARFIQKLCERLEKLLLAKKSSFVIEDIMRLVWPCATIIDIKTMKQWCNEQQTEATKLRILAPPVLPRAEFDGLCSVFKLFDTNGNGELSLPEMAKHGLLDEDRLQDYEEWIVSKPNRALDMHGFCEMMCPAGFRASQQSIIGSLPDGRRVAFDQRLFCWKQVGTPEREAPVHDILE